MPNAPAPTSPFQIALNLLNSGQDLFTNWPDVDQAKKVYAVCYGDTDEYKSRGAAPSLYGPGGAMDFARCSINADIYHAEAVDPSYGPLACVGSPILFFNRYSGSLMAVKSLPDNPQVVPALKNNISYNLFDRSSLDIPLPNTLGPPPDPPAGQLIPADSHKVFCTSGTMTLSNGSALLVHDQYWAKAPSSYAVPPMAQKRVIMEHTSGITSASSRMDEVGVSLEVGATASWATVSASISASLSLSQTVATSLTVEEGIRTVSEEVVRNASQEPAIVIVWQLTDVITVVRMDATNKITSTYKLEVAQSPPVARVYPSDVQFGAPDPVD